MRNHGSVICRPNWKLSESGSISHRIYLVRGGCAVEFGFREFKIDFFRNEKDQVCDIPRFIYKSVKSLRPDVEIESHIPDIFASVHQDAVRFNDIVTEGNPGREALPREHYEVCRHSTFGTMLNLDHLGTNSPFINEENFLKTIELFEGKDGYPW